MVELVDPMRVEVAKREKAQPCGRAFFVQHLRAGKAYIALISSSANCEHFTSFAPSIRRAKS